MYIAFVLPALCAAAVGSYLNADARASLASVFQAVKPYTAADLASTMYSVTGLTAMGVKVDNQKVGQ